ncbi:sigma-54-dependent transcriptional regulator [Nitratidesulfovibrio vulgaris]|uniref:Sigma-54 dependent DNA-binding response regulator n=1 Tax=Nitratidesulfovibrio vulgaris (strain ATCC 29579 / DSM 644 / CCUG 34227 / NCIMB 8303 / VKM B-1760 / Hildenborough) TaxID=882 RepID=Q72EN8_NITV2|nr:sigma-54 dependent transcriptional regulator [Nitratidesulfovibrio vulgaris]AAS95021.1 sigma-54 dependent DNA-binding response regulator [Nitratidesulfovibrio vulgaris str. Hildenborough]ADP85665.1 two component, sigma54 specific, transcriptional regulator, Fis family [Nitratidesulfovibrio vulgaris RCH1]
MPTTCDEHILIVDDEPDFAHGLARLVSRDFPAASVSVALSGAEALHIIQGSGVALLLTDLRMPDMDGMELMQQAMTVDPTTSVILLTAHGSIETAVAALKNGAYDFLTKPVRREELQRTLNKALERIRILKENKRLRQMMQQGCIERQMIGESPVMQRLKETIAAIAATDYSVLIRGESGTGKELVADMLHRLGSRRERPLVKVNCPSIPDQLLESELFGHVKGAFTGADRTRRGLFMSAQRGTLLLDEIGDIGEALQTKLLRVLQEREIRPVGSSASTLVDVRIIASTNRALEERIKQGLFREDLFYRLNVLTIHTPPLRERRDDIPLLADHFVAATCRELSSPVKRISPGALACLAGREWPGNVRELQNYIRRLVVFCPGDTIDTAHLRLVDGTTCPTTAETPSLVPYKEAKGAVVEDFTRRYVEGLLRQTGGNISEAARLSGIERVSLQKILRRLGTSGDTFKG